MASSICHKGCGAKQGRLERLVRPQHAVRMMGPQQCCFGRRRSRQGGTRGRELSGVNPSEATAGSSEVATASHLTWPKPRCLT